MGSSRRAQDASLIKSARFAIENFSTIHTSKFAPNFRTAFRVRTPCTTQSGDALADSSPTARSVTRSTPVLAKPSATMASEDADHCPRPHAKQSASMHSQAKNEARASALFCDTSPVLLWCARDDARTSNAAARMLRASNGGREPARAAAELRGAACASTRVPVVVCGFSARIPACKRLICMGLAQTHVMLRISVSKA